MTKVMDLPHGWALWADPDGNQLVSVLPRFRGPNGWRDHMEVAEKPAAVPIFQAVKRALDVWDWERRRGGAEVCYRALDNAKLALQMSLQIVGKWDKSLLDNDVFERSVA